MQNKDKKNDSFYKNNDFIYKKEYYQTNDSAYNILIKSKTLGWYHTDHSLTSAEDRIKYNKYLNTVSKILTNEMKANAVKVDAVKADDDNINENLNNEEVFNPTLTFAYKANGIEKTMSVSNYDSCLVDATTTDGATNVEYLQFLVKRMGAAIMLNLLKEK